MNLTRAALEKNRITAVALILVLGAGFMTYRSMPRAEDPGFIIRVATVITQFPGASPERIEMLLTDKLEKAIQEMPEVDYVSSVSNTGVSIVYVIVKPSYKEMRPIWDRLRRKVDRVATTLPEGIYGPTVNDEFGDVFGTIITLTGEGFSYAELKEVADEVRDEMLLIEEVAKVSIHGAQEERIFVEYNNARLAELGLSTSYLMSILQSQNIITPGGNITTDRERIVLEPTGNFETLEDVRRTLVSIPGRKELIYLSDLTHVYRGYIDPPLSIVRSSGVTALALAVNLREGGNIILLGEKVKALVARLQELYPVGIEFDTVAFQPGLVQKKIDEFVTSLFQAIGIVVLVMLVFLGLRTGLVVASLVPMAMIMAILLMSVFDIGLDQMSIASLIIALGMLVDNAIVMSESIMVQMGAGKKGIAAAVDSANELRIPLLTSSLTTAAAFLPIYLAESDVGEYCAPLFKVVTITLLSSWVLALTMTPLLCTRFLRVKAKPEKSPYDSRTYRAYRRMVLGFLRHRLVTLIGVAIVFIVAMWAAGFVPNIFLPGDNKPIYTAEFELPLGTPIEQTKVVIEEVEAFMRRELMAGADRPEGIINWSTYIGGGEPRFTLGYNPGSSVPENGLMIVNATSFEAVKTAIEKTENFCNQTFPDLTTYINPLSIGPPPDADISVRIAGRETDEVFNIVEHVRQRLADMPGTKNIRDSWGPRAKKILVKINQARAQRAGVTNMDIAVSLNAALAGFQTTQFRERDKIIPVTLRSVAAERQDLGKLETINVYAQATGRNVPLKQVADIEVVWEPSKILRRNRLKTVTVQADIAEGANAIAASRELEAWLQEESTNWGIGYTYEIGGEAESSAEANKSITDKLPIAGMIILLLLVAQFNSIRRPIIILTTIPLGLIGVVIGLLVARSAFGFMTLLGVVSLAGIVINNAIVLLDRIRIEIQENGLEPARAIVEAAQRRLRPILLTALTTVGGLLPLWFGPAPLWKPMAIAIIFGLMFATLLTLGVVPVLYAVLFRVKFKEFTY